MDYQKLPIEVLELSTRSLNALKRAGIFNVQSLLDFDNDKLLKFRQIGPKSLEEIISKKDSLLNDEEALGKLIYQYNKANALEDNIKSIDAKDNEVMINPVGEEEIDDHKLMLEKRKLFYSKNDFRIDDLKLSRLIKTKLKDAGFEWVSEIFWKKEKELSREAGLSNHLASKVISAVRDYLSEYENRLELFLQGDNSVLYAMDSIKNVILEIFEDDVNQGFSKDEIIDFVSVKCQLVTKDAIYKCLDELELTFIIEMKGRDYYRVIPSFKKVLSEYNNISDRNKLCIQKRLEGATLEELANEFDLTRERVRQIVKKEISKLLNDYSAKTGLTIFMEDEHRYFYENYEFDRKIAKDWLNIPSHIFPYMLMMEIKPGKKSLQDALQDYENLSAELRRDIRNYLNRNRVFIAGKWIDKTRRDIENFILREYCQDEVTFSEFVEIYNRTLEAANIPFDEKIYYIEDVIRTRENRLSDSRIVLWKQNKRLRFYDIDARDYSDIDYPEIMKKYDIRDHYELHNLLRKIIEKGSFNEFYCGRMPMVGFGQFDRDSAFLEILINHSPISLDEFSQIIKDEYGYEKEVVIANYLGSFSEYYHQGIYSIDYKHMSEDKLEIFMSKLHEDFYFYNELKKIYSENFPEGDTEEVNPYNLKRLGFQTFSRYALKNHASLEAYFEHLLTEKDNFSIEPFTKKYGSIQAYYIVLKRYIMMLDMRLSMKMRNCMIH